MFWPFLFFRSLGKQDIWLKSTNRLQRIFFFLLVLVSTSRRRWPSSVDHGISQMNCKLPNVYEGMLISQCWIQEEHFNHTSTHKMNHWPCVGWSKFGISNVRHVHLFDDHFEQRSMFATYGCSYQSDYLESKMGEKCVLSTKKYLAQFVLRLLKCDYSSW